MKLTKEEIDSSPICAQAWFGVVVESNGTGAICCEMTEPISDLNISANTFHDYQHHEKVEAIRNKMLNGERPNECWRCFQKEDNKIMSLRNVLNKHYFAHHEIFDSTSVSPENIELRMGNLCQLQCSMCYPNRSAKINNFAISLKLKNASPQFEIPRQIIINQEMYDWVENETIWEKIANQSKSATRIFINGGEPLLAKLHFKVLEKLVALGISKNVDLIYSTNALLLEEEHLHIWEKFKSTSVSISVDDIGERNRFIRFPSNWKTFEEKMSLIKRYLASGNSKINFNTWCAINMLSFAYMPEYLDYFASNQKFLSYIGMRTIVSPNYLSPINLPKCEKEKISNEIFETIKKHNLNYLTPEIKFIVNSDPNEELLRTGIDYYKHYAQFHSLNLINTFKKIEHILV